MIRRYALLTILGFVGLSGLSQTYHPLLDNTSWLVRESNFGGSQMDSISKDIDTIVNGLTYSKYITQNLGDVFLREDVPAKKVYKLFGSQEELMFDFSLQEQDQVSLFNGSGTSVYTVVDIDTIQISNGTRRRFRLNNQVSNLYWIEGVGYNAHPILIFLFSDPVYTLMCHYQNGLSLYNFGLANGGVATDCGTSLSLIENKGQSEIRLAPNPSHGSCILTKSTGFNNATVTVHSLNGQIVINENNIFGYELNLDNSGLAEGLYFCRVTENGSTIFEQKMVVL